MSTTTTRFLSDSHSLAHPLGLARAFAEDEQWLIDFAELIRTQTAWAYARFIGNPQRLDEVAPTVCVYRDGRIVSVEELVETCANHGCHTLIYEAWVCETAERVHALVRRLEPIAGSAVMHHARRLGYDECDPVQAQEALEEARRALYGDLSEV